MTETEIVKKYRPYVIQVAKKYMKFGVPFEELLQVGDCAVVVAWRLYDESHGASMMTWIHRPVQHAMQNLTRAHLRQGVGGNIEEGKESWQFQFFPSTSIDAPLNHGSDSDAPKTLHDVLGSFEEPRDVIAIGKLTQAMSVLTDRERVVIRYRFKEDMTLAEAGEKLNLSRERIRQIERDAMQKLRAWFGEYDAN